MPTGTELFAPISGQIYPVIDQKGLDGGFGRYLILTGATEQNTAIRFIFAHLSEWASNEKGRVIKGHLIGLSGNSGSSTGEHTHLQLEIWSVALADWVQVDPVNSIDFT